MPEHSFPWEGVGIHGVDGAQTFIGFNEKGGMAVGYAFFSVSTKPQEHQCDVALLPKAPDAFCEDQQKMTKILVRFTEMNLLQRNCIEITIHLIYN